MCHRNFKYNRRLEREGMGAGQQVQDEGVSSWQKAEALCNLPPDLWCENEEIALKCTGSLDYCANYVANNRRSKPFTVQLAFEAACPDSRGFIKRIYPRLLGVPFIYKDVNFEPVPWGLSKTEDVGKVKCHHGPRECTGNRLLTCTMTKLSTQVELRDRILYCFMSRMEDKKSDPVDNMRLCFHTSSNPAMFDTVLSCSTSMDASHLQKGDERKTRSILPSAQPRFVPFISINGHSHIHMQTTQLMLSEKVRAWDYTLQNYRATPKRRLPDCQTPPDFWCSSPEITAQCYHQQGCNQYLGTIQGQPIHLRVVYDPNSVSAKRYITSYLQKHFIDEHNLHKENNTGKVVLELEPVVGLLTSCKATGCADQALQECVVDKLSGTLRNEVLSCLLQHGSAQQSWKSDCSRLVSPEIQTSITQCTRSVEWHRLSLKRSALQKPYKIDNRRLDYYVMINNHSLYSAQGLAHNLHLLICNWYRGPGHDRNNCYRCDIEPTHCI